MSKLECVLSSNPISSTAGEAPAAEAGVPIGDDGVTSGGIGGAWSRLIGVDISRGAVERGTRSLQVASKI